MTAPCSCSPGACHGGHTIDVGMPLPPGRPDGPTDEVLGELLQAAFVSRSPAVAFVDETASPACTRLNGTFDLRHIVMAMAGPMRDLVAPHFAQVTRERDEARDRVAKLEAKRDTYRREYRELHISCEKRVEERNDALAVIDRVRDALSGHPRCEEHPEGDVIKCGWKRAVASVQTAVDNASARRKPIGYAVTVVDGGGRYIHTGAMLARETAKGIAEDYRQWDARVVELREVGE
ncbi:hypothetical protein [Nocardia sp. NPDC058480]|uniref:hypothetical protein n=1 Tax=Nocardia sp. NPDC058480 TaxID=3346522 RepID=UPI00365E2469